MSVLQHNLSGRDLAAGLDQPDREAKKALTSARKREHTSEQYLLVIQHWWQT